MESSQKTKSPFSLVPRNELALCIIAIITLVHSVIGWAVLTSWPFVWVRGILFLVASILILVGILKKEKKSILLFVVTIFCLVTSLVAIFDLIFGILVFLGMWYGTVTVEGFIAVIILSVTSMILYILTIVFCVRVRGSFWLTQRRQS